MAEFAKRSTNHPPAILTPASLTLKQADSWFLSILFLGTAPLLYHQDDQKVQRLLQLLLGTDVSGVPARFLAAIGGTGVQPGVALPEMLYS